MNTKAFLSLALFLLVGCASQRQSSTSTSVSSRSPIAFSAEPEEIWRNQLASRPTGLTNKAIVRAARDGIAEISRDNGNTWLPAQAGSVLPENSILRTDSSATADLFLGDNGPVIRLKPYSYLRVVRMRVDATGVEKVTDTMFELSQGRILGNVKKMAAASSYLIRTQGDIIQIRGTEFSAAADGSLWINGGAGIVHAKGKKIEVNTEQGYLPATGRVVKGQKPPTL